MSTPAATSSAQSLMDAQSSWSFSERSRNTLIIASVVGGTLIAALLSYILYKRRRGATYAQILHVPGTRSRTPQLTPTPMKEKFLTLPIYHNVDYSIHSSRHASMASWTFGSQPGPDGNNGRPKHKRIHSNWKDPAMPPPPTKDMIVMPNLSTSFLDASPSTSKPQTPKKAHVSVRPISQISRKSSTREHGTIVGAAVSTKSRSQSCGSSLHSPLTPDDGPDRWSWTNSQAPATPRLNPDSRRASLGSKYSVPRLRSVVSWARGQGERIRIDEEAPPLLALPTLQPVPVNKRAFKDASPPDLSKRLTKKNTAKGHSKAAPSRGGLGGFFKSKINSKSSGNLPLSKKAQPDIEMKGRDGKSSR